MNYEKSIRNKCPVCGGSEKIKLFYRDFSGFESIVPFTYYTVYQCPDCGMIYAGDLCESMPLDVYYELMSKYEDDDLKVSLDFNEAYEREAEFICENIETNDKVIDIGCSFGGLIRSLKEHGIKAVDGMELSEKNASFTESNLGVHVYRGGIGYGNQIDGKYDLVILSCTLEHILDVRESIKEISNMITDNGKVFISIPMAENFDSHKDLYKEFSIEHINYFTLSGLKNLMSQYGMRLVKYRVDDHESAGLAGIVYTLWDKGPSKSDKPRKNILDGYIHHCDEYAKYIKNLLSKKNMENGFYIWCAGTMTAMLYQLNLFPDDKVLGIIDSNENLQGKSVKGLKIEPPERLRIMRNTPILIASQQAITSIKNYISLLGLKNEVWTLE